MAWPAFLPLTVNHLISEPPPRVLARCRALVNVRADAQGVARWAAVCAGRDTGEAGCADGLAAQGPLIQGRDQRLAEKSAYTCWINGDEAKAWLGTSRAVRCVVQFSMPQEARPATRGTACWSDAWQREVVGWPFTKRLLFGYAAPPGNSDTKPEQTACRHMTRIRHTDQEMKGEQTSTAAV